MDVRVLTAEYIDEQKAGVTSHRLLSYGRHPSGGYNENRGSGYDL